MDVIKEKLKLLPDCPGVYVMLDAAGAVIYVGKARVLKNRVRQYFHSSEKTEKVQAMVDSIADFSYFVAPSEVDALALENNLIKKYKPKYNILLKDDKTYPYLKVTTKEEFPRLMITRRIQKDGKYFGPFMGHCKEVMDIAASVYKIRVCGVQISSKQKKPCLEYHLGRCGAPCAGLQTKEDYRKEVEGVLRFLAGNYEEAEEILKEKMLRFAEAEEFELARDLRDKIEVLKLLKGRRITAIAQGEDIDVWAYAHNGLYGAASVLLTRKGMMQGGKSFALDTGATEEGEGLLSVLTQYYSVHEIPSEILVSGALDDELFACYASGKRGTKVKILRPERGMKRELVSMAEKNAKEYLEKSISLIAHKNDMTKGACNRLQALLSLTRYPHRMECYDISNISGVDKVGSMVVFTEGEADKEAYRRFRVKTVEGADDFASLKEVLSRRLKKLGTDEEERFPKPDLIVIDGGKGQLSAVKEIFETLNIAGIDLISLAKQEEEVFTVGRIESVKIDKRDYALKMLVRIRDEAHRFAITYFRSLHGKNALVSALDGIEGIGKKKRIALLNKFGSVEEIKRASVEEIATAEGIGTVLAEKVKKKLEGETC